MDDSRITVAEDGIHAASTARTELLKAAEAALAWLDRFDAHAPEGLAFGGEPQVRRALRTAIRRAEAEDRDWDDALDADEAQALDDLVAATGCVPTERERAAYLDGYRERKAQLLGRARGEQAPAAL